MIFTNGDLQDFDIAISIWSNDTCNVIQMHNDIGQDDQRISLIVHFSYSDPDLANYCIKFDNKS